MTVLFLCTHSVSIRRPAKREPSNKQSTWSGGRGPWRLGSSCPPLRRHRPHNLKLVLRLKSNNAEGKSLSCKRRQHHHTVPNLNYNMWARSQKVFPRDFSLSPSRRTTSGCRRSCAGLAPPRPRWRPVTPAQKAKPEATKAWSSR